MISIHPFNTWPLHVKLFTEEAIKYWNVAAKSSSSPPLPHGFTCSIELEGVDGKSGHRGSGRQGPIPVDDGMSLLHLFRLLSQSVLRIFRAVTLNGSVIPTPPLSAEFTSAYLAKNTALMASGRRLDCSICHKEVHNYATVRNHLCLCFRFYRTAADGFYQEPLTTALCPSATCVGVSHLNCLSGHFLKEQPEAPNTQLIPRGGYCPSCKNYTLWGDVVKGSYRRLQSAEGNTLGVVAEPDDMFVSDEEDDLVTPKKTKKAAAKSPKGTKKSTSASPSTSKRRKSRSTSKTIGKTKITSARSKSRPRSSTSGSSDGSSEGEEFDFSRIVSSSEGGLEPASAKSRQRGRPRKSASSSSSECEQFNFINIASSSESDVNTPSKKAKITPTTTPTKKQKKGRTLSKSRTRMAEADKSGVEIFDLTNVGSSSDSEGEDAGDMSGKRKQGRSRKEPALTTSVPSRTISTLTTKTRGRPRKSSSSSGEKFDFSNITSTSASEDEGSAFTKRGRGRPRKEAEQSPIIIKSPITSPKTRKARAIPASSVAKRKVHTQVPDPSSRLHKADSSSGESFDFDGLSEKDASDEGFDAFLARRAKALRALKSLVAPKPVRNRQVKPRDETGNVNSPDIWMEDDLEQAMSAMSVSSLNRSPHPGWRKNAEVIVVSD